MIPNNGTIVTVYGETFIEIDEFIADERSDPLE
jgi:hypothetical protein